MTSLSGIAAIQVQVTGARGKVGPASGPLGNGSVGGDQVSSDVTQLAAIRAKLGFSDGGGASRVTYTGFSSTTLRTVQDRLREQVSGKDDGATGNSTTDDTAALGTSRDKVGIAGSLFLSAGARFQVSSWNNPLGIPLIGGGKVVIGSGAQAYSVDTYARSLGFIFGRENAYALFNQINQAGTQIPINFYGDSTVATSANGGIPGGANTPDVLLSDYFKTHGVRNPLVISNKAVGGTNWSQANPVPDLTAAPKMLVFKYGINHVSGQDVTAEINAMRTVLANVRADPNGSWNKCTILLVGPTSTHDTTGGRTNLWYEQLRDAYTQAAWDYGCVYIDAYGLFPDARRWAGFYSDNPAVHQQDLLRQQVWAHILGALLPPGALQLSTGNRWINLGFDGTTNSWASYGTGTDPASASLTEDGWVRLRGALARASGTAAANQKMALLPNSNYFPTGSKFFDALTYDGTNWTRAPLNIATDGSISTRDANMKNTLVALDGIQWRVW